MTDQNPLTPERVAELEQAIRMGHVAVSVDKRSTKRRDTLLALIADWRRMREAHGTVAAVFVLEDGKVVGKKPPVRTNALPPGDPRRPY